jgi:hypothetical protein
MATHGKFSVVIAVNGNRAINEHPHDDIPVVLPFIVRTVFGAANQVILPGGDKIWRQTGHLAKGSGEFPFAHFAQPNWPVRDGEPISIEKIAGVLFSNANVWHTALEPGDDFLFVQNPFGPDLTRVFDWCPRGVWERQGNDLVRR